MIMTTKFATDVPMARIHTARTVLRPTVLAAPPAPAVRLNLAPDPTRRGVVDGGWWPRSLDATAELPALIAAVDQRLGRSVNRVALSVTTWSNIPRRILVPGRTVKVGWFSAIDPLIVSLTIAHAENIILLVIPPDTAAATADTALALSTASRGHGHPADILTTAHEMTNTDTQRHERDDQTNWENKGGHIKQ